jgi:cell wall-associated NlpC family hydrolase
VTGAELAQAAAGLIGVPFRLHGRDPAHGLDCIGVLETAMIHAGRAIALPTGYALRLSGIDRWLPDPANLGFGPADPLVQPGDVVLMQPGAAQFHLLIAGPDHGWVHAHAGLRRVVLTPCLPAGPVIGRWRLLAET